MQRVLSLAIISILSATIQAEEYTLVEKPFHIDADLEAVFLPVDSHAISLKPEVWTDFTVTSVVPQGAIVKKGDTLIGIETKHIDKQIAEMEKSRAVATLALAAAKHELAQLEINTPVNLDAHARHEKQTTEDLKWYTEVGHAKEIEETKRTVKAAEMILDYQKEELKQLLKMYSEDNKTEETEEIILKRTRNYVEQAEFRHKAAKIEAERALGTTIPRKLKSMQRAAEAARIANTSAKETLPRELKQKQLAVAKAERDDQESVKKLTHLKADRAMMTITAPSDGVVYYGSTNQGRWYPTAAVKLLKIGGKLTPNATLITFIPKGAPLELRAFAKTSELPALTTGASGLATTDLSRFHKIPVTVSTISRYPETDGTYAVSLKPTLDNKQSIVPGMKAYADITGNKIDKALTVPSKFLTRQPDGTYTVKLKLADGKTENRKVTIGPSSKTTAVITKGLEKGQVIVK